jgi:hypothetical protein
MSKLETLKQVKLGERVAENESSNLQDYFYETEQWRKIYDGEVDVVYGQKGTGKSALFSLLLQKESSLFDKGILISSAENVRGDTVFSSLKDDPPPTEQAFKTLWKLYILVLIARQLKEYGIKNEHAGELINTLEELSILPKQKGLAALFSHARRFIDSFLSREASSVEYSIGLDQGGCPIKISRKVDLANGKKEIPLSEIPINELLEVANKALIANNLKIWLLFDRLDVAFSQNRDLEYNALRALFKTYLDLLSNENIALKIFVRDDLWKKISSGGFREASHIVRTTTISWDFDGLLNLITRRFLNNQSILKHLAIKKDDVLADIKEQYRTFYRLAPEKIDTGKNPETFGWICSRIRDGQKISAPRELIHFFESLLELQIKKLERGGAEPDAELMFDKLIFKDALANVSQVRYEQTLLAEYSEFQPMLEALRNQKGEHNIETLESLWKDKNRAQTSQSIADKLVEIGFFERRGEKENITYWTPFLYRAALGIVQGKAFETGKDDKDEEE